VLAGKREGRKSYRGGEGIETDGSLKEIGMEKEGKATKR